MPELSRFYGIIIRMYFADHAPPHFHAFYGDEEVVIDIRENEKRTKKGQTLMSAIC